MISLNFSCLRSRSYILLRSRVSLTPINVFSRASSLSAIHRGLRNSEKSRPQGFDRSSLRPTGSRTPPKNKLDFKIKRGKKDISDTGPKPKSRKARFHDPDEPFGKKSLVYQLKTATSKMGRQSNTRSDRITPDQFMKDFHTGSTQFSSQSSSKTRGGHITRDSSRATKPEGRQRPLSPSHSSHFFDSVKSFGRRDLTKPVFEDKFDKPYERGDSARSTFDSKFNKSPHKPYAPRGSNRSGSDRRSDESFERRGPTRISSIDKSFERKGASMIGSTDKSFDRRGASRMGSTDRPIRNEWAGQEDREKKREWQPKEDGEQEGEHAAIRRVGLKDHERGPIRIPRTTAASQFLYGRSVVEAALNRTTRQLYKLYLYRGENRQDVSQITGLERQAARAGVRVVDVLDSDGLRRMDKMSESRPHNGCVLEASPLPQPPVKSLGPSEEKGFRVKLGHQSTEEAQINGTDDFIRCDLPPNRNPFVLLLDRIQDPGNLGAILRSAAFLGVDAVGITKGHSATLNSIATKASAGASEVMKLFSVDSILDFLTRSRENDWMIYAAVAPAGRPREGKHLTLDRVDTYDPLSTSPTILVVGSEGEGLPRDTRRLADYEVSIPNHSGSPLVESLNVSVAAGILCSAFLKNQHSGGKFDKILKTKENQSESESESLW